MREEGSGKREAGSETAGASRFSHSAPLLAAAVLFAVYVLTLAPDVTFWDAGEFIAAAHSLGIPHPPGTPLFVLLENVWAKLLFFVPYAVATNLFSAAATACAGGVTARIVHRATGNGSMAFASAIAAGGMSSVWLNATETEVYAASLALGVLMIWAGDRAGRERDQKWIYLLVYLIALAVPLHLSALVAAPVAIVLAGYDGERIRWPVVWVLGGEFVLAMGAGRVSGWMIGAGVLAILAAAVMHHHESRVVTHPPAAGSRHESRVMRQARLPVATLIIALIAVSALAFMYFRAPYDPAINQGNPDTLRALADAVARRQYAVSPMWPRSAPAWVQIANLGQYADWQIALSFGPTVDPSVPRAIGTVLFLALGSVGAVTLWRIDRRVAVAVLGLLLCGTLGVVAYLNLHAGPSIGYGLLPANAVREARERDYFFVFAFWAWGICAGVGAVALTARVSRPAWTGVLVAFLPIVLNWRAVTRRGEPEQSLPRAVAEALLESTPRDGVLFVMGDNDSYPLWYAQEVLRVRPDVTVITVPLLPTEWDRSEIARRHFLMVEKDVARFESKALTAQAIAAGARRLGRPVVAAMTMTPDERAALGESWTVRGLVYVERFRPSALGSRPRAESREPRALIIDTTAARHWAAWVDQRLNHRELRPAIDLVGGYFRRTLDCPRQFVSAARSGDSSRLDSACNYR